MPFGHEEFLAANPHRKRQHGLSGKLQLGHFEAAVVTHCNMACIGCNHMSPVMQKSFMSVDAMLRDLKAITAVAEFWKFAILGGEPTLHPQIDELIEAAMSVVEIPEIALITNGKLLHRMTERFWKTIRKIEVSVYPTLSQGEQNEIRRLCSIYGVVLMLVPQGNFYKSLSGPGQSEEAVQRRFDRCPTGKECYAIDNGYFGRCPQTFIIPELVLGKDRNIDAIPLEDITIDKLKAFVDNRKALNSCSRCSVGEQYVQWHEAKRADWTAESTMT